MRRHGAALDTRSDRRTTGGTVWTNTSDESKPASLEEKRILPGEEGRNSRWSGGHGRTADSGAAARSGAARRLLGSRAGAPTADRRVTAAERRLERTTAPRQAGGGGRGCSTVQQGEGSSVRKPATWLEKGAHSQRAREDL